MLVDGVNTIDLVATDTAGNIGQLTVQLVLNPECVPGETRSCYDGPAGTLGVGLCVGGLQTCVNGCENWRLAAIGAAKRCHCRSAG